MRCILTCYCNNTILELYYLLYKKLRTFRIPCERRLDHIVRRSQEFWQDTFMGLCNLNIRMVFSRIIGNNRLFWSWEKYSWILVFMIHLINTFSVLHGIHIFLNFVLKATKLMSYLRSLPKSSGRINIVLSMCYGCNRMRLYRKLSQ